MSKNGSLGKARDAKEDEFYTQQLVVPQRARPAVGYEPLKIIKAPVLSC